MRVAADAVKCAGGRSDRGSGEGRAAEEDGARKQAIAD
jgi:hypothetical protein